MFLDPVIAMKGDTSDHWGGQMNKINMNCNLLFVEPDPVPKGDGPNILKRHPQKLDEQPMSKPF